MAELNVAIQGSPLKGHNSAAGSALAAEADARIHRPLISWI